MGFEERKDHESKSDEQLFALQEQDQDGGLSQSAFWSG
jgi:hypothetical protein|tara:strand:+ start:194 stop:307 length:114 start_codon:yes stop_codon:yes gene_type:complete